MRSLATPERVAAAAIMSAIVVSDLGAMLSAAGRDAPLSAASGKAARRHREGKEAVMKRLPRYVRINSLKTTFAEARRELKATGHVLQVTRRARNKNGRGLAAARPREQRQNGRAFTRDPDVRELLVFQAKGKSSIGR